jgi:hypothetical protein
LVGYKVFSPHLGGSGAKRNKEGINGTFGLFSTCRHKIFNLLEQKKGLKYTEMTFVHQEIRTSL